VEGTGTQGLVSVRDTNQYFCRSLAKISELYLTDDNKGRERPRKKKAWQRNFDNSVSHSRNHIPYPTDVFSHASSAVQGKVIPLQACTGPESSITLRLPDFKKIGTWRWYVCQLYAPAAFTTQNIYLVLIFVRGRVDLRATVRPEGNRTHDLPPCSIVPQRTAPPRAASSAVSKTVFSC